MVYFFYFYFYFSGKTTFLYYLKLGEEVTTISTMGFNVETVEVRNTPLMLWDVGGGNRKQPWFTHYYQNCDGKQQYLAIPGR